MSDEAQSAKIISIKPGHLFICFQKIQKNVSNRGFFPLYLWPCWVHSVCFPSGHQSLQGSGPFLLVWSPHNSSTFTYHSCEELVLGKSDVHDQTGTPIIRSGNVFFVTRVLWRKMLTARRENFCKPSVLIPQDQFRNDLCPLTYKLMQHPLWFKAPKSSEVSQVALCSKPLGSLR